jgi:hypothetical protein
LGGFGRQAVDRYEPPETARWLTKQSNEQSNEKGRLDSTAVPGVYACPGGKSGSQMSGLCPDILSWLRGPGDDVKQRDLASSVRLRLAGRVGSRRA